MSAEAGLAGLREALARLRPQGEPLGAVLLAALHAGLAADSRTLARNLDVAHAFALRALADVEEAGLVAVTMREARTGRTHYALTPAGRGLIAAAEAA